MRARQLRASMPPFLQLIRDICLLRRGPQDLPYSPTLLAAVLAVALALELAVAYVRGKPLDAAFAGALLELAFTLGMLHLVLTLRSLRNRFVQAATALLACALVFELLGLPTLLLFGGEPPRAGTALTPLQLVVSMFLLPLAIWSIVVQAHVLRHSFDVPFASGVVIAILWNVAIFVLAVAAGVPSA
jgi:hypothetical protein